MADAFEVLKQDHDEVKAMLERLEHGPTAATGATGEQLRGRKRLVDDLINEEVKHENAEQLHFWPMLRGLGPEGDRVADQALGQETEAEQALNRLDKTSPGDEEFETLLTGFISGARAHIAFEEGHAWPLMRASLSPVQAGELGNKIVRAKKSAPTRPHPNVPPQPAALKSMGPLAAAADKLRDALTGRGRRS